MTEIEKLVETVDTRLPSYLYGSDFGGTGVMVYLPHLSQFDEDDEPDPVDKVILAGQEIAAMRLKHAEMLLKLGEQDVELKRRTEIISKLVLALESSNQIGLKLTEILAKSVK